MALSPDRYFLVSGRIIVGIGIGLSSMSVPMYIAESAPADKRGALVAANVLCITTGQFLSYCVNAALVNVKYNWRWMLGVAAVPAIIQFFGMFFLPESPRYLVMDGKIDEAIYQLSRMRGSTEIAEKEVEIIRENCEQNMHITTPLKEIFTNRVHARALLIGMCLQMFQQFCAINTVMYYSPSILQKAGFDKDADVVYLRFFFFKIQIFYFGILFLAFSQLVLIL